MSLLGVFVSLSLFIFWLHCKTCEILVLQAGIELSSAARARNPNYWTIREVPWLRIFQALLLAVQGPLWGIQDSSPLRLLPLHGAPTPMLQLAPASVSLLPGLLEIVFQVSAEGHLLQEAFFSYPKLVREVSSQVA